MHSDAGGVVLRPVLAATLRIGGAPSLANLAQTRPIVTRYANSGRGYVYVSGATSLYPPGNTDGKPQIVITDAKQLADFPPGE